MTSNFDKYPSISVSDNNSDCTVGWDNICIRINEFISAMIKDRIILVIDCYHGVLHQETERALQTGLRHQSFFNSNSTFKSETEIKEMVQPDVTDDQVFGYITNLTIDKYFDNDKLNSLREQLKQVEKGVAVVYGEGAAFAAEQWDALVYLDMARWEIQLRMRRNETGNLGINNRTAEFSLQYKQAYFVDWRVLDRHKVNLIDKWDFVLDTNKADQPKLVAGSDVLKGLKMAAQRPFRVVPFFDPGPWGGQWLKKVMDLDHTAVNYAWGFDCVPEENSLLLKFGDETFEIPAIDLVFNQPEKLLGRMVYERFGAEFPIRFDFLDTMEGGNLSLQVHPTTDYIKEHFGMSYTQDESYYMLEAEEDAFVYLGLKNENDPAEMLHDLKTAQNGGTGFNAEAHVQKWPVKKHDHVLIPAGTVHCAGKNSVVLEISATPYIFTFKLWDWGRLGLDGKPRPINIDHGANVIQWDRKECWTQENLINRVKKMGEGDGWIEEQTGLHELEFIETRRHWFTKKVPHYTNNGVNVINLVEGRAVIVESPAGKFEPLILHYAETLIIPAAIGHYTITPYGESANEKCATLKAFVRS